MLKVSPAAGSLTEITDPLSLNSVHRQPFKSCLYFYSVARVKLHSILPTPQQILLLHDEKRQWEYCISNPHQPYSAHSKDELWKKKRKNSKGKIEEKEHYKPATFKGQAPWWDYTHREPRSTNTWLINTSRTRSREKKKQKNHKKNTQHRFKIHNTISTNHHKYRN